MATVGIESPAIEMLAQVLPIELRGQFERNRYFENESTSFVIYVLCLDAMYVGENNFFYRYPAGIFFSDVDKPKVTPQTSILSEYVILIRHNKTVQTCT